MKLHLKKLKIDDKLVFQWNHRADIKKDTHRQNNKCVSIDEYLEFIKDIKPHKHELYDTKIFGTMFKLPLK